MNNEQCTPKILTVWITPDPNEAFNVNFEQLSGNAARLYTLRHGEQHFQCFGFNQYYNRETQLNTIRLKDAYIKMCNIKADAVYFIIPDIRVFLNNQYRFKALMERMSTHQIENSFIITYSRSFSMKELSVLLNNYHEVLQHSVPDLLQLRIGDPSDRALFRFYLHNMLYQSVDLLEDKIENEDDYEHHGYCNVAEYFNIYALVALKESLTNAINSGGNNYAH